MSRAMCCAGCEAVARTIVKSRMADYYEQREQFPNSPSERPPLSASQRATFASRAVTESVCTRPAPDQRETVLLLEGLTCSACAWLCETRLRAVPGVTHAEVNYGTCRVRIGWNNLVTDLAEIVKSIETVGYRAWPTNAKSSAELRKKESRDALLRLAVSALGMMQVMMYALPGYIADEVDLGADLTALLRGASLLLTLPAVLYSAAPFYRRAWRDALARRAGMDLPVSLGILVAFAASIVATFVGGRQVYFDSITMFVFFLLASRYLELRARHSTARELEYLTRAMPVYAHVLTDYPRSKTVATVPAADLHLGDRVQVNPGEAFPADGRVIAGTSYADEALLTGEGRPLRKDPGSAVIGGSLNLRHPLVVDVRRTGDTTLMSHIVRLAERTASGRPGLRSLPDKVAGGFVTGVLLLALASAMYWLSVDPSRALSAAVAVLIVTCPCALSLAAPVALTAAASAAVRDGMLVTRAAAIERLASVTHVVIDKTGTLTTGVMRICEVVLFDEMDLDLCLQLTAAVEAGSEHPLAQAIIAAANDPLPVATQARSFPGRGVEAQVEGRLVRVGRAEFVEELSGTLPDTQLEGIRVWVGEKGRVLACIYQQDSLRAGAEEVIARLRKRGLQLWILSGDRMQNVDKIARKLGIVNARGELSPDQKLDAVRALQDEGAIVLMIGDGVNDAPVLSQAQVSVAMGTGAALAQSAADFVLLRADFAGIDKILALATRTTRIVRQNLLWATLYNVAAVPLAAAGLVSPWIAGLGMAASSALVVLNALRLAPGMRAEPAETPGRTVGAI